MSVGRALYRAAFCFLTTMIDLQDVTVTYHDSMPALSHITVCVQKGEFVFVVGPTGAGKSTFLKLLYREEKPTSGRVVVAGEDLNAIAIPSIPFFRRKLGIVFQDFGLLPTKTVYENVAFALRVIGMPRKEIRHKVPVALEMVGMSHRPDAFPGQLSGGEQQRVAIARALVNEPALLLADEPTGNLDPDTSIGIVELLSHINQTGTTIVVATHDTAIVDRMQKRVLGFDRGQLVRDEQDAAYRLRLPETPIAPSTLETVPAEPLSSEASAAPGQEIPADTRLEPNLPPAAQSVITAFFSPAVTVDPTAEEAQH